MTPISTFGMNKRAIPLRQRLTFAGPSAKALRFLECVALAAIANATLSQLYAVSQKVAVVLGPIA
jgi:hypothetical protein